MRIAKAILEMFFWMIAAGALLFAVGLAVGLAVAPALGYVATILMLAALPLGVRVAQTLRRRRALAAISYLEQAVRLNLPLARMLYAAQRGEGGALALRLAQFRQLLEDGYPIGAALEAGVPEVTEREAAMIESAERLGRLPQTLRKLVAEQAAEVARRRTQDVTFYRTYPFVMIVMMTMVLGMLAVFVVPKYEAIFRDFNVPLPPVTRFTISAAQTVGPIVLAAVTAAVLVWTGLALWQMFHPVRLSTLMGRGFRDRLVWATPVAHGIARDRGLADALDLIAGAVDNGTTVERALDEAAQLGVNVVLRERLVRWQQGMLGGMTLADAARAAAMPRLVVAMLGHARGGDAAAQVFRFLARYYNTRYSRAAAIASGAAVPLMVFFFGALVACVALSLFVPIAGMIEMITPTVQRL